ncbi:hypothetical protein C8J57DRAFT_1665619 [Mycena rebaudengoi]|nr:hypothetical protein C8J57DRAFT_1665619 [Mycena rebaudengoi]
MYAPALTYTYFVALTLYVGYVLSFPSRCRTFFPFSLFATPSAQVWDWAEMACGGVLDRSVLSFYICIPDSSRGKHDTTWTSARWLGGHVAHCAFHPRSQLTSTPAVPRQCLNLPPPPPPSLIPCSFATKPVRAPLRRGRRPRVLDPRALPADGIVDLDPEMRTRRRVRVDGKGTRALSDDCLAHAPAFVRAAASVSASSIPLLPLATPESRPTGPTTKSRCSSRARGRASTRRGRRTSTKVDQGERRLDRDWRAFLATPHLARGDGLLALSLPSHPAHAHAHAHRFRLP